MSGSSSHSRSPSRRNWKEFRERFDHKRIRSLKKTSQDTIVHDEDSSTRQSTSTSKGSHKFYPTHRYEDHGFSRLSTRYQPPSTSTLRKESKERIMMNVAPETTIKFVHYRLRLKMIHLTRTSQHTGLNKVTENVIIQRQ